MTFGNFLLFTSPAALLLPLVVGIRFLKSFSLPYQILSVFVFGAGLIEGICYAFWLKKHNNLFLLNIYTVWEFGLLSLFYLCILEKLFRPVIMVIFFLFASLLIADTFFISGWKQVGLFAKPVENIILIVYAICYFYGLFRQMKIIKPGHDAAFLINTAILIYFSATFYLFALSNYILSESGQTFAIWEIHVLLLWFLYSMIGLALWRDAKRR